MKTGEGTPAMNRNDGLRAKPLRRALILGLVATVFGTIAITYGPSIVSSVRARQAHKLAEEAEVKSAPNREFYLMTEAAQKGARSTDASVIRASAPSAQRCLQLAPRLSGDWNYGNAIHYANLALGRVALLDGDLSDARQKLLAAGDTPGSPQLDDFGPDMTLAEELLARGDRETVLEYLERCNRFWLRKEKNRIHEWTEAIKTGHAPDFGKRSGLTPAVATRSGS